MVEFSRVTLAACGTSMHAGMVGEYAIEEMAGMELPSRAIRDQIASAIDIIVHQARFSDGSRKITHITEITGKEADIITTQDIFLFKQKGLDKEGKVIGEFEPTGNIPTFLEELEAQGIKLDRSIFQGKGKS